ncbi:polyol transporter 5 [Mercurialis annua]|uniref:polyol transporter 5 n=1 Tax=Mercurialis annua TaxID=3986 RepID=UPI00215FBA34|nr:polyol transporter 5 [Mercurialis annua]
MAPTICVRAANTFQRTYVIRCVMALSVGFFVIGFDQSMMDLNNYYIKHKFDIMKIKFRVLLLITNLSSIPGSILSCLLANSRGRKYPVFVAGIFYLVGVAIMLFTNLLTVMIISRVAVGISLGIIYTIIPVYIAELSVSRIRGFLCCFPEVFFNVGSLICYVYFAALQNYSQALKWKIFVVTNGISAVLLIVVLLRIPESPWWLITQGRIKDTIEVLLRCEGSATNANLRLNEMRTNLGILQDDNGENLTETLRYYNIKKRVDWKKLFQGKPVLKVFISVIGLNFFQQAFAMDLMLSKFFLDNQNDKGTNTSIGHFYALSLLSAKTITLLLPMILLDKWGRRPLLLISMGVMSIVAGVYGASSLTFWNNPADELLRAIVLVLAVAFVCSYSSGLGPITWIYSSEVSLSGVRVEGMSFGIITNIFTYVIIHFGIHQTIATILPYGGVMLVYAAILALGTLFCFKMIKETRGEFLEGQLYS